MRNQLAYALAYASEAFKDKTDKAGRPYMLHCLRVMHKLHSDDDELNAIAVLHDICEDCPDWPVERLVKSGFTQRVWQALILLTHHRATSYEDYIKGIATNSDAVKVKLADLRDNSNITRLKGLTKKDFDRIEKYHKAYVYLSKL